jgi:ribosome-associated toxin RatA of RatAB toxin-antitoxin module
MPSPVTFDRYIADLSPQHQDRLRQGHIVLLGQSGAYEVWSRVKAPQPTAWSVLRDYEQFPTFLPSVVSCRILEQEEGRTVVERRDRRKIGFMPIKVRIVTENREINDTRIDYRLVKGNLDAMEGSWCVLPMETDTDEPATLVIQTIRAEASMGPLQGYFFDVFETGLKDTMTDLRKEMERRHRDGG